MGADRVVAFGFGAGDSKCWVILELYAGGNIILTDDKFVILSLLRTHEYDDTVKVALRQAYPFQAATNVAGAALADVDVDGAVRSVLEEASGRVVEGKERKKSTLKNILSQRGSPAAEFG